MSITPLNSTDTFKTWFDTTNSIIGEVNGITIHNLIAGDGISLTSNGNNVYTVKHGSVVGTPVTFTGAVSFTNTVSFANAPGIGSLTVSVSPKTSGITIGNIVRVGSTGLTLSKADSASNAEVLGVVISSDASSDTIATSGTVNNTLFANTVSNLLGIVGGTLSPGCAYFLSPTVAGGITSVEPTGYGQVSKPVILGITSSAGAILPYRGIQIDGISAGITAELDNKIIVEVDYSGNIHGMPITTRCSSINSANYPVTVGTPVWMIPTSTGDIDATFEFNSWDLGHSHMFGRVNNGNSFLVAYTGVTDGWGTQTNPAAQKILYGLISKILVNDTVNKKWIFEITRPGGSFLATYAELQHPTITFYNPSVLNGGPYFLAQTADGTTGGFFQNFLYCPNESPGQFYSVNYDGLNYLSITPVNDANNTLNIYLEPTACRHKLVTVSTYTDAYNYGSCAITSITDLTEGSGEGSKSNFISSFSVGGNGLTGSLEYDNLIPNGSFNVWQRPFSTLSGVTALGLSGYNTPIADRWFYVVASAADNPGLTVNIEKQTFDASDTTIPGSPLYWVDLKQTYTSASGLNYRPRFENVQRGARLLQGQEATVTFWAKATTSGATLDLIYNRYREGVYPISSDIEDEIAARESIASGVTLSTTWEQYSYAYTTTSQGIVSNTDEGWYGLGFEFPSAGVTLSIAQVKLELGTDVADYVYSRPQQELERCSPYYLRTYDWNQSTGYTGTSKLNEQYVTLGNLQSQKTYTIKFPVEMVQTPRSVTLYSPTGMVNEAFNVTKNTDMRYPTCEGCPIHVNLPWDTSTVRTSAASDNIVVSDKSVNGMQVTINNGATHLDTLKFHYVADADFKLTT